MDDHTEVPMTEDDRRKTQEAFEAMQAQKQQVQEDLDASLEEPVPCDFCGKSGHSFEDCTGAEDLEAELEASGVVGESYQERQNRHTALTLAVTVVTAPYGPFAHQRPDADEIVQYAEKFLAFLNA